MIEAWEMYASADAEGAGTPLRFFGPLGFSLRDRTASRVVEVHVAVVDDPVDDDYWGWFDPDADHPCHIAATEEAMTAGFLVGQKNAPGPREEQEVGLGRIVRLRVTVLCEVRVRSGRHNWKITSAL